MLYDTKKEWDLLQVLLEIGSPLGFQSTIEIICYLLEWFWKNTEGEMKRMSLFWKYGVYSSIVCFSIQICIRADTISACIKFEKEEMKIHFE